MTAEIPVLPSFFNTVKSINTANSKKKKKNTQSNTARRESKRTWAPFCGTRFWFPDPWSCARRRGPRRGPAGAASHRRRRRRRASPTSSGAPASCAALKSNDVVYVFYAFYPQNPRTRIQREECQGEWRSKWKGWGASDIFPCGWVTGKEKEWRRSIRKKKVLWGWRWDPESGPWTLQAGAELSFEGGERKREETTKSTKNRNWRGN